MIVVGGNRGETEGREGEQVCKDQLVQSAKVSGSLSSPSPQGHGYCAKIETACPFVSFDLSLKILLLKWVERRSTNGARCASDLSVSSTRREADD